VNIVIKTIPHKEHRYETCGDWFYHADGTLEIRVSKMSDWRYEFLVALHELVECFLCEHDGVTQATVDKFDKAFEKRRKPLNFDEPGDSPLAPYRKQHCLATGIERIAAACLGVCWSKYEKEIESL